MNKDKNTKTQERSESIENEKLIPKTDGEAATVTSPTDKTSNKKKKLIWGIVIAIVVIGIILAIVLPITLSSNDDKPNPTPPTPTPNVKEFNPYKVVEGSQKKTQFAQSGTILYEQPATTTDDFGFKFLKSGSLGDDAKQYKPVDPQAIPIGANNVKASKIYYNFTLVDNNQARLNLYNEDVGDAFAVPDSIFHRPATTVEARFTQLGFKQTDAPFAFEFADIYNGETLISTTNRKLFVSSKFTEIGFTLPTTRVFGLGTHNGQFLLQPGTYSLWARGKDLLPEDQALGGQQGSHVHPFLLCQTKQKDFLGIFLASTGGVAFEVIHFNGYQESVVNFITLGGHLEIYFMIRGTAQEILAKYQAIVGTQKMPPYYALGLFQATKKDPKGLQALIQDYKDKDLPIEGFQIDNYYTNSDIFTVTNATDLKSAATTLHANNQNLILGIQGHFNSDTTKFAKISAQTLQCMVNSAVYSGKPLIGKFGTDQVNYPDFLDPKSAEFLQDGLTNLQGLVGQFDGIEYWGLQFTNDIDGEEQQTTHQKRLMFDISENQIGNDPTYKINTDQSKASFYDVPFIPGFQSSGELNNKTISPNAKRNGNKGDDDYFTEYYVHNANGHMALKQMKNVMETKISPTKRSFTFTDATWAGSGSYGGATISPVKRTYEDLKNTISMAQSLSMFGFLSIVTDVCGTQGPLDLQLCGRWMQVAAFLPVARVYGSDQYLNTTSGLWVDNPQAEIPKFEPFDHLFMMTSSTQVKLQYSRYTYSQMYKVKKEGGAIVQPLAFEYPKDDNAFNNMDSTFMLGDAIYVTPALLNSSDNYDAYFPKGNWVNLFDLSNIIKSEGAKVSLKPQQAQANAYLRPGKVVPYQQTLNTKTTYELQTKFKTSFMINPDTDDHAEGYLLLDDGISKGSYDNNKFVFYKIRYASRTINFWVDIGDEAFKVPDGFTIDQLQEIKIVNAEGLKDVNAACYVGKDFIQKELMVSYNSEQNLVLIKPMAGQTIKFHEITMIKLTGPTDQQLCNAGAFTYTVKSITNSTDELEQTITLAPASTDPNIENLVAQVRLMDDFGTVNVNITTEKDDQKNYKFRPSNVIDYSNWGTKPTKKLSSFFTVSAPGTEFEYIIHKEDDKVNVLYRSHSNKLFVSDYLVMDSAKFTTNDATGDRIMGIGESAKNLFFEKQSWKVYTRYTLSQTNPIDDGTAPGKNTYGVQPFYAYQSSAGPYVGVFQLNAYAMDFIINQDGNQAEIINVLIGGFLQKYYIQGNTPEDVIVHYQSLIGRPKVPPLWSFGWMQTRYGWVNDTMLEYVYDQYIANKLPIESIWSDIDYMSDYKVFTLSDSYSRLPAIIKKIKDAGGRYVPILDPGVAKRPGQNYLPYEQGLQQGAFIQTAQGTPFTGNVWPGLVHFTDFTSDKGINYWHQQLDGFKNLLNFDGLWLDMNEAENDCPGYCIDVDRPQKYLKNKIPYVPGYRDLEDKSIGLDAMHANGFKQYDQHSLHAFGQVQATSKWFEKQNLQPFIISRSNFAGQSKFGGHKWTGDNWATWEYLQISIQQLYTLNLVGIPFAGADICGFDGFQTTHAELAPLCTRWHQLGSLYPYSRNHNNNATLAHEPYEFNFPLPNSQVTYMEVMSKAIRIKYSLIRYYYSTFAHINQKGGSFFRPLLFDWASDANAYVDTHKNILLGKALKVSILTEEGTGKLTTSYYFPQGRWCQIYPTRSSKTCFDSPQNANPIDYPSDVQDYQIHLRGGYIIPIQDPFVAPLVQNTNQLIERPTSFVILPLKDKIFINPGYNPVLASAGGFIYLNEPEKLLLDKDMVRFEIFYSSKDGGQGGDITFFNIWQSKTRSNKPQEFISKFDILWASETVGAAASLTNTAVYLQLVDGGVVTLQKASYDTNQDILTVYLIDPEDTKRNFSIFDLEIIQIEVTTTP